MGNNIGKSLQEENSNHIIKEIDDDTCLIGIFKRNKRARGIKEKNREYY